MIRNLGHRVSLTLCVFMLLASQAVAGIAPRAASARPIGPAAAIQPAAANTAPIAVDDAELVPDGSPTLVINVLANDSDPDGDPLTVVAVATPDHGAATTDGATVTYTPNAGFSGADTFDYTISDGVLTDTAIVIANVRGTGDEVWETDDFQALTTGPLNGQAGWATGAGLASAVVIGDIDPARGQVVQIDATPGQPIGLSKDVSDQSSGRQGFSFYVKMTGAAHEPCEAAIEVQTDPATGWSNKFRFCFGSSIAINNNPSGAMTTVIPNPVAGQWYFVNSTIDVSANLLDVTVSGTTVNDIPIHEGPIRSLGLTGSDLGAGGAVSVDNLHGLSNNGGGGGAGGGVGQPGTPVYWTNPAGGLWSDPNNWSSRAVPTASDHAFITLGGTYTVTVRASTTVGSLTVGANPGLQTLWIQGNNSGGGVTLTVNNDVVNAGEILLQSTISFYASNLTLTNGLLTNNRMIVVGQGTGGARVITGKVINHCLTEVDQDLSVVDTFTNKALLTLAAGKTMTLNGAPQVFNQNGGSIHNDGLLQVSNSATLNFYRGTIVSSTPPEVTNANLHFDPPTRGVATFAMRGTSHLSGDIGAQQTVWLRGDNLAGASTVIAATGFTNAGTIRMESIVSFYAQTLTVSSGVLTNLGTIVTAEGTGGARTYNGQLLNLGTVEIGQDTSFNGVFTNAGILNIAAGKTLTVNGANRVFNQNDGAIVGDGTLAVTNDAMLNFTKGAITGASPPQVTNAKLHFNPAPSGVATFIMRGTSQLSGDIGAQQTVWLRGDNLAGASTVTADSGFTNAGTIRMESIVSFYAETLTVSSGVLTNTGTIETAEGTGGTRTFNGTLLNLGTVDIGQDTSFNGTFTNAGVLNIAAGKTLTVNGANRVFNQNDGAIVGDGTLAVTNDATLNFTKGAITGASPPQVTNANLHFSPAASGVATLIMRGASSHLSGDIGAQQTVWLRGDNTANASTVTAAGSFTNAGTIHMESIVSFYPTTLNLSSGVLTNIGTIESAAGTGGTRTIAGKVLNQGTLNVDSTTLNITGIFTQTAAGDLQVAIQNLSTFGKLAVSGQATLGGTLTISRTAGFVPAIGNTFQIVTANPRSGIFAVVRGRRITSGTCFDPIYGTNTISLVVAACAANSAPTAADDTAGALEDTLATIAALGNDNDPDLDPLTITAVDAPAHGTATTNGTTVGYMPAANFNGTDVFSYTVSDGDLTDTATVTVTIAAVNDAPSFTKGADQAVAENAGAQTILGWATNISAGPADEAGQSLTFNLTNNNPGLFAAQPTVSPTGTLTYQPAPNTNGNATVTIALTDNGGTANGGVATSPPQTFTIAVGTPNSPPQANDDTISTAEDTPVSIPVLANDTDPDVDPLTVAAVGAPLHGTATISGTTVAYTPTLNFNGADVFTYTASDGVLTDTATVTVTVTPVNDPPNAIDDTATTVAGTPATIPVLANDTDVDVDPLTVAAVGAPLHGTATISGTTVAYTPTLAFSGTDVFTYVASDGVLTDTATITVTVLPANAASISVVPSPATIPLNATALLTITVDPGTTPVNGVQVHGRVDPAFLRLLELRPITGTLPLELDPPFFDAATGEFRYGAGTLGGTVSAPFDLLVLRVQGIAATAGTTVTFVSDFPPTDISDPNGSIPGQVHNNGLVVVTPAATIHATVDLQGRPAKPAPSWSIPLNVTLTPAGGSTAAYSFTVTTNQFGAFVLNGITPGRYDIRVKGNHTLRSQAQNINLVSGDNQPALGRLIEGDVETARTFNQVVLADFGKLSGAFNKCRPSSSFLANADLDENGCVGQPDFTLLAGNFNRRGDLIVPATASRPRAGPQSAGALLGFGSTQMAVGVGQLVTIPIIVDPRGAQVNGAMVQLRFDPALIEVVAVTPANALPVVLAAPAIDNSAGTAQFGAGVLGQTLTNQFTLATVTLRVRKTTAGATIAPVVDIFPASDVSGPDGSVLGETRGITLTATHKLFLPLVAK